MKRTKYLSKKERLEGYTTVANFLMSGDSKEVKEFVKHLDWSAFTIHCWEFMSIDFIRKYKNYIDWGYPIASEKVLSDEFKNEFKEYLEGIE
jgi:hypothetical protein